MTDTTNTPKDVPGAGRPTVIVNNRGRQSLHRCGTVAKARRTAERYARLYDLTVYQVDDHTFEVR